MIIRYTDVTGIGCQIPSEDVGIVAPRLAGYPYEFVPFVETRA